MWSYFYVEHSKASGFSTLVKLDVKSVGHTKKTIFQTSDSDIIALDYYKKIKTVEYARKYKNEFYIIDSLFNLTKLIGGSQMPYKVLYKVALSPDPKACVKFITQMVQKDQTVCISDRCICSDGSGYFSEAIYYSIETGLKGYLSKTEKLKVSRIEANPCLMLGMSDK